MLVSIVIPCYNSEQTIRRVVEMVMGEFEHFEGYTCEFVLVNDNSKDDTFGQIKALGKDYPCVHGINLMRNFGQHNALMAAMNYTKGDYVLGMDDDLQTHPSQIYKLLEKMQEGYDLVYGVYAKSKNSPLKNFTSWLNRVSSRILLDRPKEIMSSNFWLITRAVRNEVIKYKNYNPYVDGLFYRCTTRIGNVQVEHHKREVGTSNYTLRKLLHLWMAYWNFSVIPLRMASVLGCITAVVGMMAGLITVIRKLVNPAMTVGWASTVSIMLFFFGLVLLVLGIIGEYLGKIILALNATPQYIIRDVVNLEERE
ncbi:MAG: glycosyltransferase family 2 protein [Lachnospiraceae bacterium]|nr:glycosyltransferase family 2 protein [Lachnospiraceae bacterium]